MFQHVLEIIYSFHFNVFPFTNIEHVFSINFVCTRGVYSVVSLPICNFYRFLQALKINWLAWWSVELQAVFTYFFLTFYNNPACIFYGMIWKKLLLNGYIDLTVSIITSSAMNRPIEVQTAVWFSKNMNKGYLYQPPPLANTGVSIRVLHCPQTIDGSDLIGR